MEEFRIKTKEELDDQLSGVESMVGNKIGSESVRTQLLNMDVEEIKLKYPREYEVYLSILKTEARILDFPGLDKNASGDFEKPKVTILPAGARGSAYKVTFSDNAHVVKPLESMSEQDIAVKAADLHIGPKQFSSKEGFLHEEFIDGTPLLKLDPEKCTPEYMETLGKKFASAFKKLHENNILINDQILTDDFGKSHMIIDTNGEVRFVDFGASIDVNGFPDLSDEAVLSLMRTDPFMAFSMHSIDFDSVKERTEAIDGYRKNILEDLETKEDLLKKDLQLLNEGLYFLGNRIPNVDSFARGIRSGYKM